MTDQERTREQREKIGKGKGFFAALDQSGGSTPKALGLYGIQKGAWKDDEEMYALVHQMRTRIMTSRAFDGSRILAAILFEQTMDRDVLGKKTPDYLWEVKNVVPLLKVDQGLGAAADGVQLMKPMPALDALLERAVGRNVFGTKMRSTIQEASPSGIDRVVAQQFEVAKQILGHGLVPIIEPEVDIHCPHKGEAEELLRAALLQRLDELDAGQEVMLKLTLPNVDGFYSECIAHPRALRVVALSGGYPRDQANEILARQPGMIASFSRALSEGLLASQSDAEFDSTLDASIQSIYDASVAG